MKVLLVQPPIEDFYDTPIRTYPLGLLSIAAKITGVSHVSLADFRTGIKPKIIQNQPFPDLTGFYRNTSKSPFSLFKRYYRFGSSRDEIRAKIAEEKPDLVAISSLFSAFAEEAVDVAGITKDISEDIITVLGGTHPTLFPESVLRNTSVDFVVRGEGETPMLGLIEALVSGRRDRLKDLGGLCFRKGRDFHIAPLSTEEDIDVLPARDLLDPDRYRVGAKRFTFFLTSRGCPRQCYFCGKPPVPYRTRTITSVGEEIGQCKDLGIEAVDFEDDMLTLDRAHFHGILDLFAGKGFTLSAMNGIYSETLDKQTLHLMERAGFRRLNFSLVDINRTVLDHQQRLFPERFLELLPLLEASPFLIETHFIIGLPDQSPQDIVATLVYLAGKRLLPGPSVFYMAPMSPLFQDFTPGDQEGLPSYRMMRSSTMFPVNPRLPRITLYTAMLLTRFINYVKGVLDREETVDDYSGMLSCLCREGRETDSHIIGELIDNNRLLCYDKKTESFSEEPQDRDLVSFFCKTIRGQTIKGFKTSRTMKMP